MVDFPKEKNCYIQVEMSVKSMEGKNMAELLKTRYIIPAINIPYKVFILAHKM